VGILSPNNLLSHAEKLFENEIVGPESIAFDEDRGDVYTGLNDGRIVRFNVLNMKLENVTRTGRNVDGCGKMNLEHVCGRPLGLKFYKNDLYVVDAYLGLMKISRNGEKTLLAKKFEDIDFKFLNSLVIEDDVIYFTDSSVKFNRREYHYEMLENRPNGRIYKYNLNTKKLNIIGDGFYFPNGIAFEKGKDSVLLVETSQSSITRVYVRGKHTGNREKFATNLPCIPDNIERDEIERIYFIGCATKRSKPFSLLDALKPYPMMRKMLAAVASLEFLTNFVKGHGIVLVMDDKGNIIQTLQDNTGNFNFISEVKPWGKEYLYMGSFRNPFLARVKISDVSDYLLKK